MTTPVQIEIFSSQGCSRCARTIDLLKTMVLEFAAGQLEWRQVDVVDELDYAVELGVLSMPSIAIDGELVFTRHPSAGDLRAALQSRLLAADE